MLYYDHEARRQFASERFADLAQEARSVKASAADVDVHNRPGLVARLLQAWPSRKRPAHSAPAFRA